MTNFDLTLRVKHGLFDCCECLPIIDMDLREVSHFSLGAYGMSSYGKHLHVRMEDLK